MNNNPSLKGKKKKEENQKSKPFTERENLRVRGSEISTLQQSEDVGH